MECLESVFPPRAIATGDGPRRRRAGARIVRLCALALCLPGLAGQARAVEALRLTNAILDESQTAELTVRSPSGTVRWRIEDADARVIERGEIASKPEGAVLPIRPRRPGYFEVVLTDAASEIRVPVARLGRLSAKDPRFGVMTHFAQGWSLNLIPTLAKLGVGSVRDEIYWGRFEKKPGVYLTEPATRAFMGKLADQGIVPLVILAFGNPLYDGGQAPTTDAGRRAFAAYASRLLDQFGAQVPAVEVWNEYNGQFCAGPCTADRAAFYTAMLRTVFETLRGAGRTTKVVGIASDHAPIPYFEALARQQAFRYLDAVSIHPYRDIDEGVVQNIDAVRKIIAGTGVNRPIWATEYGIQNRSEADAAAYLVRMTTLLLSAGVERAYWYLLQDTQSFPDMGLLRRDARLGTDLPKPAFVAYAGLIRALRGAAYQSRLDLDPRTHVHRFADGDRTVDVAWSLSGDARLTYAGDPPEVYDLYGGRIEAGRDGIVLSERPLVIVGRRRPGVTERRGDALLAAAYPHMMSPAQGARLASGAVNLRTGAERFDLERLSTPWAYYAGLKSVPALSIEEVGMRPGLEGRDAIAPFRRWTADAAGRVHVRGFVERPAPAGNIVFKINADGATVYQHAFTPGGGKNARDAFALDLDVRPGTKVDFTVEAPGSIDYGDARVVFYISKDK